MGTPRVGRTQESKTVDVFETPKIWRFDIAVPAAEYKAMQPVSGGIFAMFGVKPAPPKGGEARPVHRNAFGMDLPLAYGSLVADGAKFEKVGIRYKGNGTIGDASGTIKKSFKIDLNRYDENLRFHELKSLNLNCGVADPSKARETLAYSSYRAAGVPAPRTALAEVTLTVPGKYDAEYLGLYTLVESVDKPFLRRHFKNDKGLLLKPERGGVLDYLGDDWGRYKNSYQPKRDATPEEAKRVIGFTKLVNRAPRDQFEQEIESYLDADAFLRYMAVTSLIANLDSFFTIGHNYLLYLHPETNKFHFIPWDMDRSFGNFGIFGSPQQIMDLSLTKPYAQCRLPDRLLSIQKYKDRQKEILKETAATFTRERLLKDLEAFEESAKEILAKGAKSAAARKESGQGNFDKPGFGPFGPIPDIRTFVEARRASIEAQLVGTRVGYAPAMSFSRIGAPPKGPPGKADAGSKGP
jgi:spore coat protein H